MELRVRETGQVITESEFRVLHKNTSFPRPLTLDILNSFGVDPILEGPQEQTTPPYEISVRQGIEEINGQWFTKYVAGPVFTDTEDKTAAEQEVEYKAGIDTRTAETVRSERNRLLAETDWTQTLDSPFDADGKLAWALYRETLRMIPEQDGFPHNVNWPPKPQ